MPGKFAVYGGVSPVYVLPGLFKMDVHGVFRQPGGHGHCQHLAVFHQHQPLHSQRLKMPEGSAQGQPLQQIVPVGILFQTLAEPFVHHLLSLGKILLLQGDTEAVRVGDLKFVHMVALFLEFPPLQVSQVVNGIDIVETVPVWPEQKTAGEPAFQLFCLRTGQAGESAGNAPLPGILNHGLHDGPAVAGADGIGVDAFSVKMGEKGNAAGKKRSLLPTPQVEVVKAVLAASGGTGK